MMSEVVQTAMMSAFAIDRDEFSDTSGALVAGSTVRVQCRKCSACVFDRATVKNSVPHRVVRFIELGIPTEGAAVRTQNSIEYGIECVEELCAACGSRIGVQSSPKYCTLRLSEVIVTKLEDVPSTEGRSDEEVGAAAAAAAEDDTEDARRRREEEITMFSFDVENLIEEEVATAANQPAGGVQNGQHENTSIDKTSKKKKRKDGNKSNGNSSGWIAALAATTMTAVPVVLAALLSSNK